MYAILYLTAFALIWYVLQLRITVWSLVNKTVSYIKYPKQCPQGYNGVMFLLTVAEWLACRTQARKARVRIAVAMLSSSSPRQTVHTH